MLTEQLRIDISHIIMRIQTGKNVEPMEIHNEYIRCINFITEKYKVLENGYEELIPKYVLHTMTNLWIRLDKYKTSYDLNRNKIGDHNSAYHISNLNYLMQVLEHIDTLNCK